MLHTHKKVFLCFLQLGALTCLFFFPQPWCRLITTIYNYFVVTNFFWMFVEGCYLHTAIVMTYSTDKLRKWVFLFIGWCEYVRVDRPLLTLHSALGHAGFKQGSQFGTLKTFFLVTENSNSQCVSFHKCTLCRFYSLGTPQSFTQWDMVSSILYNHLCW